LLRLCARWTRNSTCPWAGGAALRAGLMALRFPKRWRRGRQLFRFVLAIEALSTVDPAWRSCGLHNTLCVNALLRWATEEQKKHWLPRMHPARWGLRVERGRRGLGRLCSADPAEAVKAATGSTGASCGSAARASRLFIVFATIDPARAIAHHRISGGKRHAGFTVGARKTSWNSRLEYL